MPSLTSHAPKGLLRFLFRAPIWLYRAKLGWILGKRFLMLTHTGRKSGLLRRVVLEVVSHDDKTGVYFVAVGWREKADWFKNIQANPAVAITIGLQTITASAQVMSPSDAIKIYLGYAQRHPLAFRELSHLMTGKTLRPTFSDCSILAESVPLIKLLPT
jgi:deazaflavin-dependent oxidoreductase (nitroreductase family)